MLANGMMCRAVMSASTAQRMGRHPHMKDWPVLVWHACGAYQVHQLFFHSRNLLNLIKMQRHDHRRWSSVAHHRSTSRCRVAPLARARVLLGTTVPCKETSAYGKSTQRECEVKCSTFPYNTFMKHRPDTCNTGQEGQSRAGQGRAGQGRAGQGSGAMSCL